MVDTRDELLMSLLASEAIVESHDYEILSSEEVEELKKVRDLLVIRECSHILPLRRSTKFWMLA